MHTSNYIDIRDIADPPSFHDAELIGIEYRPDARSLDLALRRVGGNVEVLRFSGVIAHRLTDFASQNMASRVLTSPKYPFSPDEARTWIQWINSRDDSNAPAISAEKGSEYIRDFEAGRRVLFVLEPSCGAEMAILCETVSLKV
jgi:hypothetical protein